LRTLSGFSYAQQIVLLYSTDFFGEIHGFILKNLWSMVDQLN